MPSAQANSTFKLKADLYIRHT